MPDLLTDPTPAATRATPRSAGSPRGAEPRPAARRQSRVLAGASAAFFAAAMGLLAVELICLLVWAGESRSAAPLSAVLRTGAAFWLLGHGGRLHLPGGTAGLIPLGLTMLFVGLTVRAGATVARVRPAGPRRRHLLACALAVSIPYALLTALVAGVARGGGLRPSIVTSAVGGLLLAGLAATFGAARELPMATPKRSRVRAVAAGVGVAGAFVLAVAALVAALALLTHVSEAAALAKPARAGAVGGIGLLALQAALAPNVVAWTSAYLFGPGFAVGAGTLVSPGHVHLGDLPGLPMLAGLPAGAAAWPLYALFLTPVAGGALGAVVMVRRLPRSPKVAPAGLLGMTIGGGVGALAALLAALAGGPVMGGRLATIGPAALSTGIAAALETGIPAAIAAMAVSWQRQRRRQQVDGLAATDTEPAGSGWREQWSLHGLRRWVRATFAGPWSARRRGRLGGIGTGLAAGLGIDRLVARRKRRPGTQPETPTPVDLVKRPAAGAEAPEELSRTVDLSKVIDLNGSDDMGQTVDLTETVDLIKQAAAAGSQRRWPHRPGRKSKVIKLPD